MAEVQPNRPHGRYGGCGEDRLNLALHAYMRGIPHRAVAGLVLLAGSSEQALTPKTAALPPAQCATHALPLPCQTALSDRVEPHTEGWARDAPQRKRSSRSCPFYLCVVQRRPHAAAGADDARLPLETVAEDHVAFRAAIGDGEGD
jgi:hypothetical protein